MVLAFMAQHVWEVSAGILAVLLVGDGLLRLITGSGASWAHARGERATRMIGGFAMALGVGIGIAAFTVDAEQPGVRGGNGWGGTSGIVILSVWVTLICIGPATKLIKVILRRNSGRS